MPLSRRTFIKGLLGFYTALLPQSLMAIWPKQAFIATEVDQALQTLYGDSTLQPSDEIDLKLNKRVENGDNIAVSVSTTLKSVESITLLVKENSPPLVASFNFDNESIPYLSTRLKLSQSSEVMAVIRTPQGLFSHQQKIKVLSGSCV